MKTKQREYRETLQIKWLIHIYKWFYQRKHFRISKYSYGSQAIVHAHAISLALIWSPVSDRERKRAGSPQRAKQMVSSGHTNSSGQSCLWGGWTSGQEVPERKTSVYPEASWPLKVRGHVPKEYFIAQCSFKALEINWRSQLCFMHASAWSEFFRRNENIL